jgi:hypothetical protein
MTKLWCDCKTNQEKLDFLRSGRAVETGIIAPAIVEDVAKAFEELIEKEEDREWMIMK